jgi:hypothetical protein
MIQGLLSKHKALSSNPSTMKKPNLSRMTQSRLRSKALHGGRMKHFEDLKMQKVSFLNIHKVI